MDYGPVQMDRFHIGSLKFTNYKNGNLRRKVRMEEHIHTPIDPECACRDYEIERSGVSKPDTRHMTLLAEKSSVNMTGETKKTYWITEYYEVDDLGGNVFQHTSMFQEH